MRSWVILLAAAAALPALADTQFRAARMTRNDVPPGKGQCDIRLQVDNTVEVSVHGDMVNVHTLAGRDARDDGSECNAPMPDRDLRDFNFEVKDSRGEIRLTAPPSPRNGFRAIVSIHDGAGGEGRYHFRLSWAMGGPREIRRDFEDRRPGGLAWNNTIHSSVRGRGESQLRGDPPMRLGDVNVDIDRGGRILVAFRTERGGNVSFTGDVMSWQNGEMKADVAPTDRMLRIRGPMMLYFDASQNVYRITLEATNGQDRLRLNWERR